MLFPSISLHRRFAFNAQTGLREVKGLCTIPDMDGCFTPIPNLVSRLAFSDGKYILQCDLNMSQRVM